MFLKRYRYRLLAVCLVLVVASAGMGWANDLDDGISVDDNISSYDTMGKTDQNIKFIKLNAKSQAKRRQQSVEKGIVSGDSGTGKSGGGAMNSVVMGAGSNVRGDIIIIDESKGDKTQVVE